MHRTNVDQIRARLVAIADELRDAGDDDFAEKHRLNTEADGLRQQLSDLLGDDEARSTLEEWAARSARKSERFDLDTGKVIPSPGEGGSGGAG